MACWVIGSVSQWAGFHNGVSWSAYSRPKTIIKRSAAVWSSVNEAETGIKLLLLKLRTTVLRSFVFWPRSRYKHVHKLLQACVLVILTIFTVFHWWTVIK